MAGKKPWMKLNRWLLRVSLACVGVGACTNGEEPDGGGPDAMTDALVFDHTDDMGLDTGVDATADVSVDVTADALPDALGDAADAPTDAPDAPNDAVSDAPFDGGGIYCLTNTDCAISDYCNKVLGNCSGIGSCSSPPPFCPKLVSPVCGCDGMTYENSCLASQALTSVAYDGNCE
jgi:Kazal-type serine protease inhibitor domain